MNDYPKSDVHQPGVEDREEQGPLLLLRHHRAGDIEAGELCEAGPEDVGMHPGEAHTREAELLYVCPCSEVIMGNIYLYQLCPTFVEDFCQKSSELFV